MEVKNINIFSPLILLVVIFFYVLFAIIGTQYHLKGLSPVSLLTYLYIIYGSLIFIVGILFAKVIERKFFKKNLKETNASSTMKTFIDYIQNNSRFKERNVLIFVLIPLIVQLINLYFLGGIPLFSGYLKAVAYNNLTVVAYCIFLIAITSLMAKFYHKKYFLLVLIGLILFAATGYRATLVGIILSVLITIFYVNGNKFKYLYILTPVIIVSGLIVGYMAAISIQWQHWNVDPLSLVFIRAGYTLTILSKIVAVQNSSHGLLTYSVLTGFLNSMDPRLVLGQYLLKYHTSITSTIFGPAILDVGYLGLAVQMFFLGLVLELLHYLQTIKKGLYSSFYAIGLASTIVWVETGPMDLAVWIYYLLGVILIITAAISIKDIHTEKEKIKEIKKESI
jgi:oligosaccharide repeat unit polymerase